MTRIRQLLPVWLVLAAACVAMPTVAVELVTPKELAADRAAPEVPLTRATPTPGAPRIELDAPRLDADVKSPLDIRLRWTAEDGAAIVPGSLRILYGRLGIDITKRVATALRVSASGMEVTGAELPSGTHRIKIEVSDDRKRTGARLFEVTIAGR